jgi:hypothetical protein
MSATLLRPYLLFWLAIPLVLVLGLSGAREFDVQWLSMYSVLDRSAVGWTFAGYLALIGVAYWVLDRRGWRPQWGLTLIHLGATVLFFGLVLSYSGWISEYRGELIEATQSEAISLIESRFAWRQQTLAGAGLFFALAQLVFVVNAALAGGRNTTTAE